MFHRHPIRSLSRALQQALEQDLLSVETPTVAEGRPSIATRRPREQECDTLLFGQVWSGDPPGLRNDTGPLPVELDTVVVVGPAQDACVYVSTELCYHVIHPNRRFYLDVAAHSMAPKAQAKAYEDRDDAVTEAVDIEVEAMLARLHAQVQAGEPQRASLVASYLRRCAARFEGPTCPPTSERWALAPTDERLH